MGQITGIIEDAETIDRIEEVQTEIIDDLEETEIGRRGKGIP